MSCDSVRRDIRSLGVTGHRFLADEDRLVEGIDEALAVVRRAFPAATWQVLSSLAEGADRMVARRAISTLGACLVAVLPLPVTEYCATFSSREACEELRAMLTLSDQVIIMPQTAGRLEAYREAGLYVLAHCDVLVALWDGRAPHHRGGTSEIVHLARQHGVPLAWVHCGNRVPGTFVPTTLGDEQGLLTLERISLPAI